MKKKKPPNIRNNLKSFRQWQLKCEQLKQKEDKFFKMKAMMFYLHVHCNIVVAHVKANYGNKTIFGSENVKLETIGDVCLPF